MTSFKIAVSPFHVNKNNLISIDAQGDWKLNLLLS